MNTNEYGQCQFCMRYRRVRISGQYFVHLCLHGSEVHGKVLHGLPVGTTFLTALPCGYSQVEMIVEHPSFDFVDPTKEIPLHPDVVVMNLPCAPRVPLDLTKGPIPPDTPAAPAPRPDPVDQARQAAIDAAQVALDAETPFSQANAMKGPTP